MLIPFLVTSSIMLSVIVMLSLALTILIAVPVPFSSPMPENLFCSITIGPVASVLTSKPIIDPAGEPSIASLIFLILLLTTVNPVMLEAKIPFVSIVSPLIVTSPAVISIPPVTIDPSSKKADVLASLSAFTPSMVSDLPILSASA